jgi:hypothetical protein
MRVLKQCRLRRSRGRLTEVQIEEALRHDLHQPRRLPKRAPRCATSDLFSADPRHSRLVCRSVEALGRHSDLVCIFDPEGDYEKTFKAPSYWVVHRGHLKSTRFFSFWKSLKLIGRKRPESRSRPSVGMSFRLTIPRPGCSPAEPTSGSPTACQCQSEVLGSREVFSQPYTVS